MTKLSANRAAKEAGVAKKTLLESLTSGRLTATKNDKGHWEIEPAELFRVFPQGGAVQAEKTVSHPPQRTSENSALEIEVKMLREQIERMDKERERERAQLGDQIEVLRAQAERQSADHRQALAALTDQREKATEQPKRGLWARLVG